LSIDEKKEEIQRLTTEYNSLLKRLQEKNLVGSDEVKWREEKAKMERQLTQLRQKLTLSKEEFEELIVSYEVLNPLISPQDEINEYDRILSSASRPSVFLFGSPSSTTPVRASSAAKQLELSFESCVFAVLTNASKNPLSLGGWFLSTQETKLNFFFREDASLQPGQRLSVCLESSRNDILKNFEIWEQNAFSLRKKDVLFLCDPSRSTIANIPIFDNDVSSFESPLRRRESSDSASSSETSSSMRRSSRMLNP